jgi:hypothetical protein
MPTRELGKTDVVFEVWTDGEKFGTLKVSKGSLVWFPKDRSKGHKIGWKQFDANRLRLFRSAARTDCSASGAES